MSDLRSATQNRRRQYYDRFPATEVDRRFGAVRSMLDEAGLEALVVPGDANSPLNVAYLTNYSPAAETYLLVFADPAEPTLLLVGVGNHLQYVRELAEADEVDVLYPDRTGSMRRRLDAVGVGDAGLGVVGRRPQNGLFPYMPPAHAAGLGRELVDVTADFTEIVAVKSGPELERVRRAAELTDHGMGVLVEAVGPGVTEVEVRDALDRAYLETDGRRGTTFITSATMEGAEPGEALTWHRPSGRPIAEGDVVGTEFGAVHRGYRSQIHRALTVGSAPTELYRDIWAVAEETYESMLEAIRPGRTAADVHDAMAPLTESDFKMYDVMLHGYGSGIVPPLIGTERSEYWPGGEDPITASWTFSPGEVLAVQPNVVTEDERAGMQLGTTVVVRDGPPELLHDHPVAFERIG